LNDRELKLSAVSKDDRLIWNRFKTRRVLQVQKQPWWQSKPV